MAIATVTPAVSISYRNGTTLTINTPQVSIEAADGSPAAVRSAIAVAFERARAAVVDALARQDSASVQAPAPAPAPVDATQVLAQEATEYAWPRSPAPAGQP